MSSQRAEASFIQRFGSNLLRWYLWIVALGVGYHTGQFVVLAIKGAPDRGLVIFLTGAAGYVLLAVVPGAAIALLSAALPSLKIFPTTLATGALRSLVIGFVTGIVSIYSNPSMYLPAAAASDSSTIPCNAEAVETQFGQVMKVTNALENTTERPSKFLDQADKIWALQPACVDNSKSFPSDEVKGKYLDSLLIGNAVSVFVYLDAKQYKKARSHLNEYQDVAEMTRPIAQAKGWTMWLAFDKKMAPLMKASNKALINAGYPPAK